MHNGSGGEIKMCMFVCAIKGWHFDVRSLGITRSLAVKKRQTHTHNYTACTHKHTEHMDTLVGGICQRGTARTLIMLRQTSNDFVLWFGVKS